MNIFRKEAEAVPRQAASFARVHVGRIVAVRIRRLADLGDVDAIHMDVLAAVQRAGPGAVICADQRLGSLLRRDVADAWSRAMRSTNSGISRSGVLIDPANTGFNLQAERVVHCAGNPNRRIFADAQELCKWVGDVLTEPERNALQDLFADGIY
ncbi:MAG: hypothetical protein M3O46_08330 [Myxococcota bacterium]|nr:hypothetical protein [Myxococcota bacterium]